MALALLFVGDVALDSFDADCASATTEQACHACLCRTHAVSPDVTAVTLEDPGTPRSSAVLPHLYARLIDKSFLQPPKLPA